MSEHSHQHHQPHQQLSNQHQLHQQLSQQNHQNQQQLSPARLLAALPDSFMHISSTPQCRCQVRRLQHPHHQPSPCTPSSSLLSFTDSSASFSSEQSCAAASPQAAQLADGRRRLRLMRREEGQLRRLVAGLDSRLANASGPADKDLLALQRMSAESVLRTVQTYVAAKSEEVTAATSRRRRLGASPPRGAGGVKCDSRGSGSSSDSSSVSLFDF